LPIVAPALDAGFVNTAEAFPFSAKGILGCGEPVEIRSVLASALS
jgi:hypothetical protein